MTDLVFSVQIQSGALFTGCYDGFTLVFLLRVA
jgi:hypothetical protein